MFQLLITKRECSALCPLFSADCKPTNGSETRASQPTNLPVPDEPTPRCLRGRWRGGTALVR